MSQRAGYGKGVVANPFAGDDIAALGLRRTAALLRGVGWAEMTYQIVHVAGTKGKGSVSAMVEALVRAAGRKTGLYATPHLHTFRERIQVGGVPASEKGLAALDDALVSVGAGAPADQP